MVYELHGLTKNPLAEIYKKELCPLTKDECDFLYAKVEGFGNHVSLIEQWFADKSNFDRLNSILILGDKGSGRSSVANYIAQQFYLAQEIDQKIPLLRCIIKSHHDLEPVRDLIRELYNHLCQLLGQQFEQDFRSTKELYRKIIFEITELLTEISPYQNLFLESLPILKSRKSYPIIIADKIITYQQLNSIQEVFNKFSLIIYTTDKKEIQDEFKRRKTRGDLHGFTVKLDYLSLEDVGNFLSHRWTKCSATNQLHPFDQEGLENIFKTNPYPFKGVVTILTEIFTTHLESQSDCSNISKDKMMEEMARIFLLLGTFS